MVQCAVISRSIQTGILLRNLRAVRLNNRHYGKSSRLICCSKPLQHAESTSFRFGQNCNQSQYLFSLKLRTSSVLHSRFYSSSLPPHTKLELPALSPTMETGTIVRWEIQEGEAFSAGDLLADIETDKATVGFEANDDGVMAKILAPEGTKDLPLGAVVAITVDDEDHVSAFANYSLSDASAAAPAVASPPPAAGAASPPPVAPAAPAQSYPAHDKVLLPALSPTMTTGTIVSWEVAVGDEIGEGDAIATIETDKASMALEYQDEGYLAKILLSEGAKDIPLGTPVCIIVPNEEDVAAFKDYVETGDAPVAAAPVAPAPVESSPPASTPSAPAAAAVPPPVPASTAAAPQGRVFASPLAKKLASEKGLDINQFAGMGSGPNGRIRAVDLSKQPAVAAAAPVQQAAVTPPPPPPTPVAASVVAPTPVAAPKAAAPTAAPTDDSYVDIDLSNIRKVTAQRLCESKQQIPHYYLTVDVQMDNVLQIRKEFNADLAKDGVKISVNDFIIKASALACMKVPEANSSWRDTFIRQYNKVDMSVAVSTPTGLITPIVTDAHHKGLSAISQDVVRLAGKARDGKLRPEEFIGGTFTISNLGMMGVKQFTAIINPPQSCILAVGSARKEFIPDEDQDNGMRAATLVSVTLSCDHRVVDGAVGARWLQYFKKYLEDPLKMLL